MLLVKLRTSHVEVPTIAFSHRLFFSLLLPQFMSLFLLLMSFYFTFVGDCDIKIHYTEHYVTVVSFCNGPLEFPL